MDIEKGSVKRRKKCSKRSRSSSSSSEDNNSGGSGRKRRLKESKLTKNNGKELTRTDVDNKGDELGRKTKGRKRRGNKVNRKGESEDSSSWSSSESEQRRKKKRKEKKRKQKKKKKKIKKKEKELKQQQERSIVKIKAVNSQNEDDKEGQQEDILSGPKPMKSTEKPRSYRVMVPMTKEEYEKQQSQVRRVFDPDTGRERLVKGDGEIVEEVVSYEKHKEINKLSTFGDGAAFQTSLGLNRYTDNKIYRR